MWEMDLMAARINTVQYSNIYDFKIIFGAFIFSVSKLTSYTLANGKIAFVTNLLLLSVITKTVLQ